MKDLSRIVLFIHAIGGWNPKSKHPIESLGSLVYLNAILDAYEFWRQTHLDCIFELHFLGGQTDAEGNTEASSFCDEFCHQATNRNIDIDSVRLHEDMTNLEGVVRVFYTYTTVEMLAEDERALLITDEVRRLTVVEELTKFCAWTDEDAFAAVLGFPRPDISKYSNPEFQLVKIKRIRASNITSLMRYIAIENI